MQKSVQDGRENVSVEENIRKVVTKVEEIRIDGEKSVEPPIRKSVVAAVIKNPCAGKYVEDLSKLMDWGETLGKLLTKEARNALEVESVDEIENYGKGGIVGSDGELEHIAAILHPKLGTPMREEVGGGAAIIPSAKKMGAEGTTLDVPLHYKDAAYVRSHYDAIEISIQDAPRDDEILVAIAVTNGGRPHPRIGGLQKEEAKGEDGLR